MNLGPGMTPQRLAYEVKDLIEGTEDEMQIEIDNFGCFEIRLKNNLIENIINASILAQQYRLVPMQSLIRCNID